MMNPKEERTERRQLTLRIMWLTVLAAILLAGRAETAQAQWTSPDGSGNISNTNTGNVGIGTTTPSKLVEVRKDTNVSGGEPAIQITNGTNYTQSNWIARFRISGNIDGVTRQANFGLDRYFDNSGAFFISTDAPGGLGLSGNNSNTHFKLTSSGNAGVGTSAPLAKFQVVTTSYTDTSIYSWDNRFVVVGSDSSTGGISLSYNQSTNTGYLMSLSPSVAWRNTVINPFAGNVGIGLTAPGARLEVDANAITNTGIRVKNTYNAAVFAGIEYSDNSGNVKAFSGFQPSTGEFRLNNVATGGYISFMINGSSRMLVANNGNVGVGKAPAADVRLDVEGNLSASGTITGGNIIAKYQDVAEWVPSRQKLSAGTVVILDPEKSNQVIASTEPYDTRVAGVISGQPGVLLGEGGEGKVKVATTGRVKVKVDATGGPIKIGDLLVTSDKEGMAMKSEPILMQGRRIHAPGTIIGKALEPLEKGKGEIQVLLSLQ